ncbi:MAG: pyridoxal-phosphate dependent enzyme, partial [Patescibacteria group bacterium]
YCQTAQIKAIILVSPTIPQSKLAQIIKFKPYLLIKSPRASRLANYISKKYQIHNLKPSQDNLAITGFETLGWEIHQQNPDCDAIFTYATSGASLLGIHQFYQKNNLKLPRIVAVQSGQQTFLPQYFGQKNINDEINLAGQNSPTKPIRANQIIKAIQASHGTSRWVNNHNIKKNQTKLKKYQINSSPEGAATLAAAIAFAPEFPDIKNITCIISGTEHPNSSAYFPYIPIAHTKDDIDNLIIRQKLLAQIQPSNIFFAYITPLGTIGIETILPINIASFDAHPIDRSITQRQINLFTLANQVPTIPKRRSTSTLLRHNYTKKWINQTSSHPLITVLKPSPSLEKICQRNNWQLLANPAKINRHFENKITFSQICTRLKLPQPSHQIKKLDDISYTNVSQKYGHEFFIQFPRGFAGSSTFLIKNNQDLQTIKTKYLNRPSKISQKITGPTYTLNGCVTQQNGIIIQKPFFQITNIPELNSSAGGTCGNIYSNNLKQIHDLKKLVTDAQKFGHELQKNHYRGIFGLDFVLDSAGHHYFIECNPRLTASIPMITKLQIKNNEIPLLLLHLLEFLKIDYHLPANIMAKITHHPQIGSQIIFRNTQDQPSHPPLYYKTGVYSISKITDIYQLKKLVAHQSPRIKYRRPGQDILDINHPNEFLIVCEPKHKKISPDIEYLRIQSLI